MRADGDLSPSPRPRRTFSAAVRLAVLLLAGLAVATWQSLGSGRLPGQALPEVKVAIGLPLRLAEGQDMLHAVRLAFPGGVVDTGNAAVRPAIFDSSAAYRPGQEVRREARIAREIVADPTVVAYLGPISSQMAPGSLPRLNRAGMLQVSPAATWPGLTKIGFGAGEPAVYYPTRRRHFFRLVPTDDLQGEAAARWAADLGLQKVFVVDDGLAYGRGIAGIFELKARDFALEIVGHESLEECACREEVGGPVEVLAGRIQRSGADLLYLGGTPAAGNLSLIATLRREAPHVRILVSDGFVGASLLRDLPPELIEGIDGTSPTTLLESASSSAARDFALRFEREADRPPSPLAVATYEALEVILHVIGRARRAERSAVLAAMADLGEYSGLLGTWHFNAEGDTSLRRITCLRIEGGNWRIRPCSDS